MKKSHVKTKWRIEKFPFIFVGAGLLLTLALWGILAGALPAGNSVDLQDYPERLGRIGLPAARFFPTEIPEVAQDAAFSYQTSMAGTVLSLRYTLPQEAILAQLKGLPQRAKWMGTVQENDSKQTGIFDAKLFALQDETAALPADLILYLIHSKPYRMEDWNHGELGYVALSQSRATMLFYYEQW